MEFSYSYLKKEDLKNFSKDLIRYALNNIWLMHIKIRFLDIDFKIKL